MPPCRAPPAHPRARLWQVDPTSNMLIAVPGGNDGPGGVLVCSENFIVYKNHGHADKRCALPRRRDLPTEHGLLLVSSAVHRQRDLFFILVQSEFGDLYKVTLGYEEDQVSEVKVRYLDSVPVCSSLCILKSGFLFCAAEFGNHGFYQFQGVGDDEDSPLCTSAAFDAGDETVVELEPRPLRCHTSTIRILARTCTQREMPRSGREHENNPQSQGGRAAALTRAPTMGK